MIPTTTVTGMEICKFFVYHDWKMRVNGYFRTSLLRYSHLRSIEEAAGLAIPIDTGATIA